MDRISQLRSALEKKTIDSVDDVLADNRKRLQEYDDSEEYPCEVIAELASAVKLTEAFHSPRGIEQLLHQLAKSDLGLASIFFTQFALLARTVDSFGSEEQKKQWLPRILQMQAVGSWALTEKEVGSDASALFTTVSRRGHEYIINGNKRWVLYWPGRENLTVLFARNEDTDEIVALLVDLGSPGIKKERIKSRLALRSVPSYQIHLRNVRVSLLNRLPRFRGSDSLGQLLDQARRSASWIDAGCAQGLCHQMMKYLCNKRNPEAVAQLEQQLVQAKVFKAVSRAEASLHLCHQLQLLHERGLLTSGQAALVKAYCSEAARDVARLAREAVGVDGIFADHAIMKLLVDAEAVSTYAGTSDINVLVVGRELTTFAAFKSL